MATRRFFKALLGLGLAALLTPAAAMSLQDQLLYFPARATVGEMEAGGLTAWPSKADFRGLLTDPTGPARGTVIVFHGNAGHAGHRGFYAAPLNAMGLRVILAEYPGYGPRDGSLGEASLVADAERTIELAERRYGRPLLLIGESLGAGVAAAAAAGQREKIAGLLLITPWDRLEHIAAHHYPWLPVGWLLRDRYDSAAKLAAIGRPVLVAVAEHDRIVPARYGRALHAALAEPKRLLVMAGAGHNDWLAAVDARWWREAAGFLLSETR